MLPLGSWRPEPSTLPQLKYTVITSSTLMVIGALTFFDLTTLPILILYAFGRRQLLGGLW